MHQIKLTKQSVLVWQGRKQREKYDKWRQNFQATRGVAHISVATLDRRADSSIISGCWYTSAYCTRP